MKTVLLMFSLFQTAVIISCHDVLFNKTYISVKNHKNNLSRKLIEKIKLFQTKNNSKILETKNGINLFLFL